LSPFFFDRLSPAAEQLFQKNVKMMSEKVTYQEKFGFILKAIETK